MTSPGAHPARSTGGSRILRVPMDRRSFQLEGTPAGLDLGQPPGARLLGPEPGRREAASKVDFLGYDRLHDGVRVRTRLHFAAGPVDVNESLSLRTETGRRRVVREFNAMGVPAGAALELAVRKPSRRGSPRTT